MIRLSRESMEEAFVKYLETVFEHPEIIRASVRNIVINRKNTEDAEKRAFEEQGKKWHRSMKPSVADAITPHRP